MSTLSFDAKRKRWVARYIDFRGIRRAPTFVHRKDAKVCLRQQEIILASFEGVEIHHRFGEASRLFVSDLRAASEETRKATETTIKLYLAPLDGKLLVDISSEDLDEIRQVLEADEREASAKIAMRLLRRIFKFAEARAWLPEGHWEKVWKKPPRLLVQAKRRERRAENPTLEEVSTLLNGSRGLPRMLFHMALLTGMRIGEILAVRWSDIDAQPGFIRVDKTRKKDGTCGATKTAAGVRHVPISGLLRLELEAWRQTTFRGPESEIIWTARVTRPMRYNADYWMGLEQARLGIGTRVLTRVDGATRHVCDGVYRPHRFRAACAALWVRQGVPVARISAWLGHASTRVTMEIYAYLFSEATPERP